MPIVLSFSGLVASGKSTLSDSVASSLGWPKTSFGDYVRSVATTRGIEHSRERLQALGEQLILQLGWNDFSKRVLDTVHWTQGQSLVVDGIRHVEVLNVLKTIVAPTPLYSIYISISSEERELRLVKRNPQTQENIHEIDTHSTEVQVGSLLSTFADLILDGNRDIEELTKRVLEWIKCLDVRT